MFEVEYNNLEQNKAVARWKEANRELKKEYNNNNNNNNNNNKNEQPS